MSRSNPVSRREFWEDVSRTIARLRTMGYDCGQWTYNDVFRYMACGVVPAFELEPAWDEGIA